MKSSGVEKSIWQPEVTILLELKKKLEAAQKTSSQTSKPQSNIGNAANIKQIEEEVSKQVFIILIIFYDSL